MTGTEFVGFVVLGFSVSMFLFFVGQMGRVLMDAVESFIDRKG